MKKIDSDNRCIPLIDADDVCYENDESGAWDETQRKGSPIQISPLAYDGYSYSESWAVEGELASRH